MTRIAYDSTSAQAIHNKYPNPQIVLGYVDGLYVWSEADWALFPHAIKVPIAVFADTNAGTVLDCEPGNCTPAQSVDWVLMRRKAGVDPTVYCNEDDTKVGLPAVRAAFQARKVKEPHYWVANYDAVMQVPSGTIAKQYWSDQVANIDYSVVADYWPGVDPAPVNPTPASVLSEDDDMPQQIETLDDHPSGKYSYLFPKGQYREVAFGVDTFGGVPAQLRVVFWTAAGADIRNVTVKGLASGVTSTVLAFSDPAGTYAMTVTRTDAGASPVGLAFA